MSFAGILWAFLWFHTWWKQSDFEFVRSIHGIALDLLIKLELINGSIVVNYYVGLDKNSTSVNEIDIAITNFRD